MWGRHSRSAPPTGSQGNVVPPPISFRYLRLLLRETVSLSPLGYLATVPGLVTGPKLLNLPNDAALSFFLKPVTLCGTELLPLLSRETILWHRRCNTVPATVHSAPQKVAYGTTYDRGSSSDRHTGENPSLRPRRGHASMLRSDVEPSISRRRPLEPKRRDHAHAQGPGHVYIDLPAPAGRSA